MQQPLLPRQIRTFTAQSADGRSFTIKHTIAGYRIKATPDSPEEWRDERHMYKTADGLYVNPVSDGVYHIPQLGNLEIRTDTQ